MDDNIEQLSIRIGQALLARHWKLVTAESCTAGGIAYALTSIPGSSKWFERGFVTYSNLSKEECLNVNPKTLEQHGAVSEETVTEMAQGALHRDYAEISLAVTGIAGPDGGSQAKPVGTVWFGIACADKTQTFQHFFKGDRQLIRELSIKTGLEHLITFLSLSRTISL